MRPLCRLSCPSWIPAIILFTLEASTHLNSIPSCGLFRGFNQFRENDRLIFNILLSVELDALRQNILLRAFWCRETKDCHLVLSRILDQKNVKQVYLWFSMLIWRKSVLSKILTIDAKLSKLSNACQTDSLNKAYSWRRWIRKIRSVGPDLMCLTISGFQTSHSPAYWHMSKLKSPNTSNSLMIPFQSLIHASYFAVLLVQGNFNCIVTGKWKPVGAINTETNLLPWILILTSNYIRQLGYSSSVSIIMIDS